MPMSLQTGRSQHRSPSAARLRRLPSPLCPFTIGAGAADLVISAVGYLRTDQVLGNFAFVQLTALTSIMDLSTFSIFISGEEWQIPLNISLPAHSLAAGATFYITHDHGNESSLSDVAAFQKFFGFPADIVRVLYDDVDYLYDIVQLKDSSGATIDTFKGYYFNGFIDEDYYLRRRATGATFNITEWEYPEHADESPNGALPTPVPLGCQAPPVTESIVCPFTIGAADLVISAVGYLRTDETFAFVQLTALTSIMDLSTFSIFISGEEGKTPLNISLPTQSLGAGATFYITHDHGNESGESDVAAFQEFFGFPADIVRVLYDDVDYLYDIVQLKDSFGATIDTFTGRNFNGGIDESYYLRRRATGATFNLYEWEYPDHSYQSPNGALPTPVPVRGCQAPRVSELSCPFAIGSLAPDLVISAVGTIRFSSNAASATVQFVQLTALRNITDLSAFYLVVSGSDSQYQERNTITLPNRSLEVGVPFFVVDNSSGREAAFEAFFSFAPDAVRDLRTNPFATDAFWDLLEVKISSGVTIDTWKGDHQGTENTHDYVLRSQVSGGRFSSSEWELPDRLSVEVTSNESLSVPVPLGCKAVVPGP
ncbi:unnamed protein product [Symbiodinium sp. CCMP2592]|nr:unnamed protein product [Symbiodinium sp. CCMP2592]